MVKCRSKFSVFAKQVRILVWKNFILFKHSYASSACEILLPLIFIATLIVVRKYVDKTTLPSDKANMTTVIDRLPFSVRRNRIFFYPDTTLTRQLVMKSVLSINSKQSLFTPRGEERNS